MSVVIGIDPHKGSHVAAAIDGADQAVAEFEVRASSRQASELLAWAERFGERQLGGRVSERPWVSVGAAAGGRWGACGGCTLDSGFSGSYPRFDEVAEERRQ
jgi:hypothetical protein